MWKNALLSHIFTTNMQPHLTLYTSHRCVKATASQQVTWNCNQSFHKMCRLLHLLTMLWFLSLAKLRNSDDKTGKLQMAPGVSSQVVTRSRVRRCFALMAHHWSVCWLYTQTWIRFVCLSFPYILFNLEDFLAKLQARATICEAPSEKLQQIKEYHCFFFLTNELNVLSLLRLLSVSSLQRLCI